MAFEPYRQGQGTYARATAAVATSVIALFASYQIYNGMIDSSVLIPVRIPVIDVMITWGVAISTIFFVGSLVGIAYLYNKPKVADFLIETQIELQKVSWPTREELRDATIVVISLTVVLGAFVFAANKLSEMLMRVLGVLPL